MNSSKFNWKKILIIFFVVLALIFLSIYSKFRSEIGKSNSTVTDTVLIEVKSDESVAQIGTDLASLNLITNANYFYWLERFSLAGIKPGFYEITAGMSMRDIVSLLDSGKTKIIKVTIPEGYRLEQIARKISSEKICSYSEFIVAAKGKEGKLFPDTYFFNPRMTATEVVTKMTDDYEMRTSTLSVTTSHLVLASIVEKEAANDTDRSIIAGIYSNRIKTGMKLQSDPTVAYARDTNNLALLTSDGQIAYDFWKPAKTIEFTSVKSVFNTYQNDGLPPAPICNPGLASIQAAVSPGINSYYFFLYGSDGKLHTARTQAEHNANIARYL